MTTANGETIGSVADVELRNWFAGQALCGILAANKSIDECDAARWAYEIADEMLKEGKSHDDQGTG